LGAADEADRNYPLLSLVRVGEEKAGIGGLLLISLAGWISFIAVGSLAARLSVR
jgi:hypothetical protein